VVPIARAVQVLGGATRAVEARDGYDNLDVPNVRGSLGMEGEGALSDAGNAWL
jgi:hypothetical protein